jgi:hypothetical protein
MCDGVGSGVVGAALLHFLHVCGGPGLPGGAQPHPQKDLIHPLYR